MDEAEDRAETPEEKQERMDWLDRWWDSMIEDIESRQADWHSDHHHD